MSSAPEIASWKKCPVTASIALLSVGLSLLWWSGRDMSALFCSFEVSQGQVYRLLTSTLLHLNFLHLAFDVYWFWVFGSRVELVFGHWRAAAIYILLGATSSAAQYALSNGGVGLSGIGYGLFGLVWMLGKRDNRFANVINQQIVGLFLAWFVICIVTTKTGMMQVGNFAHGAGLIMGVLLGLSLSMDGIQKTISIGLAITFGILCFPGALVVRPVFNREADLGQEYADLGYRAQQAKRFDEAAEYYQKAINADPKKGDYYYNLGTVLGELDRYDEAVMAFAEAAKLSPGSKESQREGVQLAAQGYRALQAGQLEEAVRLYKEAIAVDGQEASHWYNLGLAQSKLNKFKEAQTSFEQAVKLDPADQGMKQALLWCQSVVAIIKEEKEKKANARKAKGDETKKNEESGKLPDKKQ
jgi:membrane associated rhomboid family serine protease